MIGAPNGKGNRATGQTVVNSVVDRFHPERIILFGSYARGEGKPDSDADFLIVMNLAGSKRQQAIKIDVALEGIPRPIDLIVVTPDMERPLSIH